MRRWLALSVLALLVAGCASGPRMYSFQASEARGATRILNRLGSEAKPYVEGICPAAPTGELKAACSSLRKLYRGTLTLADGIDEAMNKADAENKPEVDLDKVLALGLRLLDLLSEEEAVSRMTASRGD